MLVVLATGMRAPFFFFFSVAFLGACSLALDTGQIQCESDADCTERGLAGACVDEVCVEAAGEPTSATTSQTGAGGATTVSSSASGSGGAGGGEVDRWSCLGDVEWLPADPDTRVTLNVSFRSATTSNPPPDLSVRYCSALDPACNMPIEEDIPISEEGSLSLEVDGGTVGFFEITGPTVRPTLLYFPRPASEGSTLDDLAVTLVTEIEYGLIVNSAGFESDETRGTLLTVTTDCAVEPAAGVRIDSARKDAESTIFYFISLVPDPSATQTDVSGYGGIFNMPVGAATVEASITADERWIGVSSFQIRAGWLTNVSIEPTPTE